MRMAQVAALAPPVLAALAAETEHAGGLCARLEELVSKLTTSAEGEVRDLALSEAQTLDVLTQHLDSLTQFMRGLSAQLTTARSVDTDALIAQVPLGDLASRLRAVLHDATLIPPPSDAGSGDLDLF